MNELVHDQPVYKTSFAAACTQAVAATDSTYRVAQKSKPLPNKKQIVFNLIKVCQLD